MRLGIRSRPTVFALFLVSSFIGFSTTLRAEARYVSWAGMEADKGAAAWYLRRHVAPDADIDFVPYGAPLGEGIAFDVPQARYRRTHNATTFDLLLIDYPSSDPVIKLLASVIRDIEINAWGTKRYAQSTVLENVLKEIAGSHPGGNIPVTCFVPLFDSAYVWLAGPRAGMDKLKIPRQCISAESKRS